MEDKKKHYTRLLASSIWRRARAAKLQEQPRCEACGRMATEVHHRQPVESGETEAEMARLAYNPSNLMSVCHQCHVEIHTKMGRTNKARIERRKEATARLIERMWGRGREETGGEG